MVDMHGGRWEDGRKDVSRMTMYGHVQLMGTFSVELMWKSRWGIAKIIYVLDLQQLWNRYFSLVVVRRPFFYPYRLLILVNALSRSKVQASSSTILIATVDFVLMLRVWILYGRQRWMMWCFASLGIAEVVAMTIVDVFAFAQMREYVHLGTRSSVIKGCYAYSGLKFLPLPFRTMLTSNAPDVPKFLTIYAAVPLLVTFVMFALTLYKCLVTLYRMDHGVMPFWTLFLRDGIIWFVLVFAAGGSELVIWTARRETLKQILVVPALVVYSGVASHSLLNIKQIMAKEASESQLDDFGTSEPILFISASSYST
ncbi:hypothetical protein C8F04DRAFT_1359336 [Mycena alexandri]|uniref:Uncharacterized protein n=1 Tax=Mycena alexandri TaxID=1745969 RepID=A0AAD6SQC8_9AGAR|nr:hypothetical protein C8F04DRAFT_1359336 [Mycena alexandri]